MKRLLGRIWVRETSPPVEARPAGPPPMGQRRSTMTDRKYGQVTLERPPSTHPIVWSEPCFVLRGSDVRTPGALRRYADHCRLDGCDPAHVEAILVAADEIEAWQREHRHLVHRPD